MNKWFLIVAGVLVLVFYLTSPVPYCNVRSDNTTSMEIKAASDVGEIEEGSLILLHVNGNSMAPTIKDNSRCLCVKTDNYDIGDIIAFVSAKGQSISHRIVAIDERGFFTKGDNNDFIDPPSREENIICEVPEVPTYLKIFKSLN